MTRVIHTADTHIGYQQYNSPERRSDFLSAFRAVVDDALDDEIDAVVHAGDLFHDRRPGLVDLQGTIEILRDLADADVPFLAIVGNHESKRDAQWLDLFADLGLATRLGAEPVVVADVAFYGLDYVPQSRRDALTYDFAPVPDAADRAVLVAHGLFEPFAHATWDTEAVLAESAVDFDAVFLGDNHAPETATVADTWVTYCGSTERASAAERDPRGYNLVSLDGEVSIRRRAIADARDFVFVDVELAADEGIDRVLDRLSQHDVDDAVVIVTIEGDGEPISPAPIEESALERGALVARANDRRDLPDEADAVQVSFADPDAAVTDRLRELELSSGALAIDETVRDETVADSNVREAVERRVRDALDGDGLDFADAPPLADPDPSPEGIDDETTDDESTPERDAGAAPADAALDGSDLDATDADDPSSTAEPAAATGTDEATEPADDRSADDEPPSGNETDATDGTGSAAERDSVPDAGTDDRRETEDDDAQVSIGDFS